jgi:DNA-binding response OmpR family regulator
MLLYIQMKKTHETILVIERDPEIVDLIISQSLLPAGYIVEHLEDSNRAIEKVLDIKPEAIIINIGMPGLNGKDFLVGLNSQGLKIPVVVVGARGAEADIVQAFRLGAADYLLWPSKEAEVHAVVEKVLALNRARREHEYLHAQYSRAQQHLKVITQEMQFFFSLGKVLARTQDPVLLAERILEAALILTRSDVGWLLKRGKVEHQFYLAAERNLPISMPGHIDQPWEDNLSSLAVASGKTFTIQDTSLEDVLTSPIGEAALVSPIMAQNQMIGILNLVRKKPRPYGSHEEILAEAVCDFASLAMVNCTLLEALEKRPAFVPGFANLNLRAKSLDQRMLYLQRELSLALDSLQQKLIPPHRQDEEVFDLSPDEARLLVKFQVLRHLCDVIPLPVVPDTHFTYTRLDEQINQSIVRVHPFGEWDNIMMLAELPSEPVVVQADPLLVALVVEGLLSNAVKYSVPQGKVMITLEINSEKFAQFSIENEAEGVSSLNLERLFESGYHHKAVRAKRFSDPGIPLSLMYRIISAQGGKIWVERTMPKKICFHITLPVQP